MPEPDLRELIDNLSPGALQSLKQRLAALPDREKQMAFSRLGGIPKLSDIVGQPARGPMGPQPPTREAEIPLWQRAVGLGGQALGAPFAALGWAHEKTIGRMAEEMLPRIPPVRPGAPMPGERFLRAAEPVMRMGLETLPYLAIPGAGTTLGVLRGAATKAGAIGKIAGVAAKVVQPIAAVEAAPVKLVGAIAKAPGAISAALGRKTLSETARFIAPANELLERQLTKMDWQRTVAQRLSQQPALKSIIEKVGGRAATVTGAVEDDTARALLVGARVQGILQSKGQVAMATLQNIHPDPIRLFGVDEATGLAGKVKASMPGASRHISDIAEHPARYLLNPEQKAYIKQLHSIEDWVLDGLKEAGVDVKLLKFDEFSHWVHREVIGKNIDDALVKITPRVGGRIGAKASWEKTRFYEEAADGVKKGLLYEPSLERVTGLYVQTAAKRISDQRIASMVASMGQTPLERLAVRHPGFKQVYDAIRNKTRFLTGGTVTYEKTGEKIIRAVPGVRTLLARVGRGEVLPEVTLVKIEKEFPELGAQFRQALEISMPDFQKGIARISNEAFAIAKITREKFVAALEMARLTRNAQRPLGAGISISKNVSPGEITATLHNLNVDTKTGLRMVSQIYRNVYKLASSERKAVLNDLRLAIKAEIPKVRAEWAEIEKTYRRTYRIAQTPSLGTEATIQHPAFQGKIYPKQVADEIQKYWDDIGWGPLSKAATISGEMRTLVASADYSAAFIQGLPGMFHHPGAWARGMTMSFKASAKPQLYENYLSKNLESLMERANYGGYVGGFEYMEAMPLLQKQAGQITQAIAKRPQLGKEAVRQTYGRFEASFGSFGDVARNEMWQGLKGRCKTPEELTELARHIDRMTGVMSSKGLGIGKTQRDFEQAFLFFAPRYTRAGFALIGDAFKGGMTGAETRWALGKLMACGFAAYIGTCLALGQEINWDPTTGRFMTIEITDPITGTTRHFGIGGMMTSLVRFGADVTASAIGAGQNEPLDFVKLNRFDNPFIKFAYSKSAPLTGFIEQLTTRQNYFGEPFENASDYAMFLGEQVMPIAVQQALQEEGGLGPTALAAGELGLRSFPRSDWEKRDVTRDAAAQAKYKMTWDELGQKAGKAYQLQLERDNPELQAATQKARETSSKMARGEGKVWDAWNKEGEAIEQAYRAEVVLASKEFEAQRDGVAFKERIDDATMVRREKYGQREINPQYAEIYAYFAEPLEPDVLAKMNPNDIARKEYYKIMYSPDMYNQFGRYNFDEAEKREAQFVQRYGQAALDYIEEYKGARWEEPMPMRILREAKDILKPYWDIADQVWSMYSPELKTISDQIALLARTDPAKEKQMLRRYPQIMRARELIATRRKQMRDRNPAIQQAVRLFY